MIMSYSYTQGCECEFKKRAEIVLKTQKMAWKHKKRHILGISTTKKELKSALKLNSHTPAEHIFFLYKSSVEHLFLGLTVKQTCIYTCKTSNIVHCGPHNG